MTMEPVLAGVGEGLLRKPSTGASTSHVWGCLVGALERRGLGLGLPTSGRSFDGVEVGYVCELDALPVALIVADEERDHDKENDRQCT